jgi:hypothetical protein
MERLHFYFIVEAGWDHPRVPEKPELGKGIGRDEGL